MSGLLIIIYSLTTEDAPEAHQYSGNSSPKPYAQAPSFPQRIPIQIQQQQQTSGNPPMMKSGPYTIPIRMSSQSPAPGGSKPQQQKPISKVHQIKVDYDGGNNQNRMGSSEQTSMASQGEMKYMGGNIPSRSFKILQAMTVGDTEADGKNYCHLLTYFLSSFLNIWIFKICSPFC